MSKKTIELNDQQIVWLESFLELLVEQKEHATSKFSLNIIQGILEALKDNQ